MNLIYCSNCTNRISNAHLFLQYRLSSNLDGSNSDGSITVTDLTMSIIIRLSVSNFLSQETIELLHSTGLSNALFNDSNFAKYINEQNVKDLLSSNIEERLRSLKLLEYREHVCINCLTPLPEHQFQNSYRGEDNAIVYIKKTNLNIFEKYFKVPYSLFHAKGTNIQALYWENNKHYFNQCALTYSKSSYKASISLEQLKYLYNNLWSIKLDELSTSDLIEINTYRLN